jgi:DNA end-binding protein Ku
MSRPIWTGSINFGLVSIPVEMQMAVHEKTVHFHMLSKDGHCRLRRKLYCPQTGKEYDFGDTARGVEVGPENYAIVDQAEINRLKPEKGRSLEIVQFIGAGAVDPVFYDRVYYLKPGKDAYKAYKLLMESMISSKKTAIARFVMRERQYLCLLRPIEGCLGLHTMHYADEVEQPDVAATEALGRIKLSTGEMNMAAELIKAMTRPLKIEEFKDEYREQLQDLVDAKVKGKELKRAPAEEEREAPRTINLMEALKRSLASNTGRHNGHQHRRSA